MKRRKRIGRVVRTGVDVLSYGKEREFVAAAKKIDMGVAEHDDGIFFVMAQAGVVKMRLFNESVRICRLWQNGKRKDQLLQAGKYSVRIVCGGFCFPSSKSSVKSLSTC